MRETKEGLENVSSSLEVLQEGTGRLKASLSDERASLSNTLSDPACTNGAVSHTCSSVRSTLAQLGANADFSQVSTHSRLRHFLKKRSVIFTAFIVSLLVSACRCQSSLGPRQHHPGHRPQQHRSEGEFLSERHLPRSLHQSSAHVIICSSRVTRRSMTHQDS